MKKYSLLILVVLNLVSGCSQYVNGSHNEHLSATAPAATLTPEPTLTPTATLVVSIMKLPGSPEVISKVCQFGEYTEYYCPSLRGYSPDGTWEFVYCMDIYDCEKPSHYVMYNTRDPEKSWVVDNEEIASRYGNAPFGWHIPAWTDNNQSAYMLYKGFCEHYPGCGYVDAEVVYEFNMISHQTSEVLPDSEVPSHRYALAFSPDEQLLAYIVNGTQELIIRDLGTNLETKIHLQESEIIYGDISWSPDGERFVMRSSLRESVYDFSLWLYDRRDQSVIQLLKGDDRDFFPVQWMDNDSILLHLFGAGANQNYEFIYTVSTGEVHPASEQDAD